MARYRLTENSLRRMVREAVRSVMNEVIQGNSSVNGYGFNWKTGEVERNGNGPYFSSTPEQQLDDRFRYMQNQRAEMEDYNQRFQNCVNDYMSRGVDRATAEKYARQDVHR